jgi:hypothetical protein
MHNADGSASHGASLSQGIRLAAALDAPSPQSPSESLNLKHSNVIPRSEFPHATEAAAKSRDSPDTAPSGTPVFLDCLAFALTVVLPNYRPLSQTHAFAHIPPPSQDHACARRGELFRAECTAELGRSEFSILRIAIAPARVQAITRC